jgi:hypothetical protein
VSRYLKLAVLDPSGIETELIVVVSPVSLKTPPLEFVVRLTPIEPVVTGLLDASWRWTVIVPLVTPAVSIWDEVVNTSLVATWTWTGPPVAVEVQLRNRAVTR